MKNLNKELGFNYSSEFCEERVYVSLNPSRIKAWRILKRMEAEVKALRDCTHDADLILSYFHRMVNPVSEWDGSQAERILYTILGAIQPYREDES